MMETVIVLGGSLVAVAVMVAFAWMLRLGGGAIAGEREAIESAEQIFGGFEGTSAAVGTDGQAALVRGADGSVALLKQHGARVAGRLMTPPIAGEPTPEGLRIATGEARFGAVTIRGVDAIPAIPG